ncbi:MAG: NDP-sugar synthase [Euryarchaeota archaeon]|nr:NDP-sugar synthase [Euryarchaeota archaeon]MBU4607976.1 NDP-sugar synthase [Euryarchaeota archaeon]MBV1730334.1 NDP-sugar synthase [Methanobacterium sp.]MBV1754914.1 NDP-sugar synthase [Methanobacterium sp.]
MKNILIHMIKTIIMAGGKGSRILPLTSIRPKPMIPVANRPLIHYIIEKLSIHGFKDLVVTLNYLPHEIKESLKKNYSDLHISYSQEKRALGTAGGVRECKNIIEDTFMVLSGDVLVDMDWNKFLRFHREKKALASILLIPVEDPSHFGIAVLNENQKIVKFLEKPLPEEVFSKIANAGAYIFEKEIFEYIDEEKKEVDFSHDVFPRLIEEQAAIYGYTYHGYWNDVGRPNTYLKANYDVLNRIIGPEPRGKKLKERLGIYGDIWCGDNVFLEDPDKTRIIGPVVIGNNCIIEKGSKIGRNTVLGDNVFIGRNCNISGSLILNNSTIESNSYLKKCIIDTQCTLEKGTIIESGVILGSFVETGSFSKVKSKNKVNSKIKIPANSIIDSYYTL